jgi:hypothetical protein
MQQRGRERKTQVSAALSAVAEAASISSQGAVAREIGVGTSVLSRWLAGQSEPEGKNRGLLLQWHAKLEPPPNSEAEVFYLRGALAAIGRMGVNLDELAREFAGEPAVAIKAASPTPAETGAVPPPPATRPRAAEG